MKGSLLLLIAYSIIFCSGSVLAQAPVITLRSAPVKLTLADNGTLAVPLNSIATVTAGAGSSLSVKLTPAMVDCSLLGPQKITVVATNLVTTPSNVKFNNPKGLATDANGNIYVADYGNSKVRKIDVASGEVTTYAGSDPGYADGAAAASKFLSSFKVAIGGNGNVFVMDGVIDPHGSGGVYGPRLRKIALDGKVTTFAGSTAGLKDGTGADARFLGVGGLAAAPSGDLYVSDNSTLRKVSADGTVTTLVQIGGYAPSDSANLSILHDVCTDAAGNVYVNDSYNNYIWKYSAAGKLSILAKGEVSGFGIVFALTADQQGNVYIADGAGVIRKITAKGNVSVFINADDPYVSKNNGHPFSVSALCSDPSGNIYVLDGSKIWKVSAVGLVTLFAGSDQNGWVDGNIGGTSTGATATAQIQVIVVSTPTITTVFKDVNIFANSLGKALLPDYTSITKTTDNCSNSIVTVTQSPAAGTQVNVNTTVIVTITATDTGGGTASKTFKVTAVDPSAPIITPNTDPIVIYLDETGHKTIKVPDIAKVTSDINPNPYSKVYPSDLDCSNVGQQMLTVTANDGTSNPIPTVLANPYAVVSDAQENLYVTDAVNHVIRKISPAGYVTVFAGSGADGSLDGTGTATSFGSPKGIAIDKAGNLYVADQKNNNIRKISSTGAVTTLAGTGSAGAANGPVATATFNGPLGVAVDNNAVVYVADAGNNRIRMIANGVVSTLAGEGSAGLEDGPNSAASFYAPRGIALNGADVYVADANNKLRKISGGNVTTISGANYPGANDGPGLHASFSDLHEIFFSGGYIYLADGGNNYIRSVYVLDDVNYSHTYAGNRPTSGITYTFNNPTGLTFGPSGTMYVVDAGSDQIIHVGTTTSDTHAISLTFAPNSTGGPTGNQSIRVIPVTVMSTPVITSQLNNVNIDATVDCVAAVPDFTKNITYTSNCASPVTITQIPAAGTIKNVNTITKVTVTATDANGGTQSRSFSLTVTEKGPFINALAGPLNFTLDADGHKTLQWTDVATVFSCISPAPAVKITPATFDCTTTGKQNVLVSATTNGSFSPSKPGQAAFYYPLGMTADAAGNLYIADSYNHRIRKISPLGDVTTIAGSGKQGSDDGVGADASFFTPVAIAVDAAGNLFVSDQNINKIRKVTPEGIVTTFAGGTGGSVDGIGTNASFNKPNGLAFDASGNLYVADQYNNLIRKITPQGLVSTVAGNLGKGFSEGKGSLATFNLPAGIAVDPSGNLYIADSGNDRIRKITPDATVSTVAGNGSPGKADGVGKAATFYNPTGLTFDDFGNLYITDQYNNEIRKIDPSRIVTTVAGSGAIGSKDGTGTEAEFYYPNALVFTRSGLLYVADAYNSVIRSVDPGGKVLTIAGTGLGEFVDGNVGSDLLNASSSKVVEVNILNKISISSSISNVTVFAYNSCPAVVPDLTKQATASSYCSAIPVTFTQLPLPGSPITLGVPVTVTLTASDKTGATASAMINVNAILQPDAVVTITTPSTEICAGGMATFTATAQNSDATAVYQWLVNGAKKGIIGQVFSTTTLADGDQVSCQLLVGGGCTFTSNTITIIVDAIPIITLKPDMAIDVESAAQLDPLVTGKVISYTWTPIQGLDHPNIRNPKASPVITTKYTLTVQTAAGCPASAAVTVAVLTPLKIPNSFTPNNDGVNDLWTIKNIINYPDCQIDVFNRYGRSVYHSLGYTSAWDGKFNGLPLPTGTYYYILKLPKQGQALSGNISIIR